MPLHSTIPPDTNSLAVVRLEHVTDDAIALLAEYYEAIHVVLRDTPEALHAMVADSWSGLWVAYLHGQPAGCVALRRLTSIPLAAECKRLYVRPVARGHGIATALLDTQEVYARSQGLRWVYLDSYDDLTVAIALYRKRGYLPCERYSDNPQATVFFRKDIGDGTPIVDPPLPARR
jgi:GNAT superfamily N-acetyltransferase